MTTPVSKARAYIPHRFSPTLAVFYGVLLVLVVFLCYLVDVDPLARLVALLSVFYGSIHIAMQVHRLLKLKGILVDKDNIFLDVGGEIKAIRVSGNPVVSEFLIAFSFAFIGQKLNKKMGQVVLLADSISGEDHHRLRLMLMHGNLMNNNGRS